VAREIQVGGRARASAAMNDRFRCAPPPVRQRLLSGSPCRGCACCKGFIHGCSAKLCRQLGVCTCAYEDDDGGADGGETSAMHKSELSC